MVSSALYPASALRVSGGPIRSLKVSVDPALTGRISLEMRADDEKEVAAVTVRTKGRRLIVDVPSPSIQVQARRGLLDRIFRRSTVIHGDLVGGRSDDGRNFQPTLDLTLHVPSGCPLRLDLSGSVQAVVGDVMSSLTLDVSGSVEIEVGSVLDARVDASGSSRVGIAATQGGLRLDLTGSVRVGIGHVGDGDLSLRSSGSGKLVIDEGEIGEADVRLTGASVVKVNALIARDLAFDGTGSFKADFIQVLGQADTSHTGSGTIRIGGQKHRSA